MRKKISIAAFAAAFVALSLSATADTGPQYASCFVEFERSYAAFDEFEYDTGWLGIDPVASPDDLGIGMRIFVHAAGEVKTYLPGEAILSDGAQDFELTYEGEEDGGELELDVGVLMAGKFAYNLGIFGSGITDLPLVPNFDFLFYDLEHFTPFLLDGSEEAPVVASEEIEESELYTLDIVEVLTGVDIPGLGGGIVIYAGGSVSAQLEGLRIVTVQDAVEGEIVHEAEGAVGDWEPSDASSEEGEATYEADVELTGVIDLTPTAFLEVPILGTWEIVDVTIPIELMDLATTWDYDAQPLAFDVGDFGDDDGDTGPDTQSDAGLDDGEGISSSGCGCDVAGARTGGSAVGLFGLLLQ